MQVESQQQRRKRLRLSGFDYSSEGGYFITIVTHGRIPLFGEITNNEMICSKEGEIARLEWFRTMQVRENVELFADEFMVMPNHIHGIIWLTDGSSVGVERRCDFGVSEPSEWYSTPTKNNRPLVLPGSIPAIIRAYKSAVTYAINSVRNTKGRPVWQRNYFEHIIRDEKDYDNIVEYIYQNPYNWETDKENNW